MFVTPPRTATAIALALGLATPLSAQEAPPCAEGVALPCVTDTGAVVETEEELRTYIEAFSAEAEAAEDAQAAPAEGVEGAEDVAPAAEEAPAAGGAEAPAAESAPAEEGAADETPAQTAPAEAGTAPEAPTDAAPAEEGAADETPAETAPVEEGTAPEAPAESTAAEPPPESAPAAEPAPVEEGSAAEAPPEAAPADEGTAAEPPPEAAPAEQGSAAEVPAETAPAEQGTAAEAPTEAAPADEDAAADAPVEAAPAEGDAPADVPAEAASQPEAPPPTAAADAPAQATAAVEEVTVTEETARSSDEDFETAIGETPAATATEEDDDDDNETLKRVIAAGLAGAALGALIDQGNEVVSNSGDRLVLRQDDGDLRVLRDENALLLQPGARVRTETFDDGSTRTTVLRDDGTQIVTIRAADGTVLRRTRLLADGREVTLIDDTGDWQPVDVSRLPEPRREVVRYTGDEEALREALAQAMAEDVGRSFSLRQIRDIDRVRYLAPEIEIDAITFETGSAAIRPEQARRLAALGRALVAMIDENPAEVFLVEGHTDAVGDASYNLALSDRRAESVALALTEYFDVPPENLVVQGYGEFDLKVETDAAEVQNRRANVRRITPLLGVESAVLR